MSPNKDETAVHCCNPALLVLVMLGVSNVFHVVSALQFIVFTNSNTLSILLNIVFTGTFYFMGTTL